jgi:hypothetical protein
VFNLRGRCGFLVRIVDAVGGPLQTPYLCRGSENPILWSGELSRLLAGHSGRLFCGYVRTKNILGPRSEMWGIL